MAAVAAGCKKALVNARQVISSYSSKDLKKH